jgi:hypothetical protein
MKKHGSDRDQPRTPIIPERNEDHNSPAASPTAKPTKNSIMVGGMIDVVVVGMAGMPRRHDRRRGRRHGRYADIAKSAALTIGDGARLAGNAIRGCALGPFSLPMPHRTLPRRPRGSASAPKQPASAAAASAASAPSSLDSHNSRNSASFVGTWGVCARLGDQKPASRVQIYPFRNQIQRESSATPVGFQPPRWYTTGFPR